MRHGKKPTRKQKIRLGRVGLSPENWLTVTAQETEISPAAAVMTAVPSDTATTRPPSTVATAGSLEVHTTSESSA